MRREAERTGGVREDAIAAVDVAQSEANAPLDAAAAQLDAADSQIDDGRAQLERQRASAYEQLDEAQCQLDATRAQIDSAMASADTFAALMGDRWPASAWARLQNGDATAKGEFVAAIDAGASEMSRSIDQGRTLCG